MKKLYSISLLFLLICSFACSDDTTLIQPIDEHDFHDCDDICVVNDGADLSHRVWQVDNKTFLYGGEQEHMHFDVSEWDLITENLRFGLGRETIPAVMNPVYTAIRDLNAYPEDERCIVIRSKSNVKVYPLATMRRFEIVNETIDDQPVMIAYCLIADYAEVLSRTYCNREFTFALSGYTYAENGIWGALQGFVLWDRDTESLWWPLNNRAVSGPMKNTSLQIFNPSQWQISSWSDVIKRYPDALILSKQQPHEIPSDWLKVDKESLNCQ